MTRLRSYGRDVAFLEWMRGNPALDSHQERLSVVDVDILIHRYADRAEPNPKRRIDNVMMLETKSHARGPMAMSIAQHDTWGVLNALWRSRVRRHGSGGGQGTVRNYPIMVQGQPRRVRWWGVHVLSLSGDRPENSVFLWWDERAAPIDCTTLERLLRFELDPFTFGRVDYRDHHEGEKTRTPLLKLAD